MEKTETISDVAIYLRKSRGDEETDLDKHRMALTELCENMGVNHKEYAEIGTSDSIQDRPKFSELLADINQDLYDAVAVMDIDRLGRGDDQDWGQIEKLFKQKKIFIITPDRAYNWDDENDEQILDWKKFFARLEYKQISKRLRRGKILGAKEGRWTNGKPPYPYVYDSDTKSLKVDVDKKAVYKLMLGRALQGYSAEEIAWELNKLGHPSPRGKYWSSTAVYRLLFDETHMGKIVFHKQKGSGHKHKKAKPLTMFDKSEWIIVDGKHEVLKTQAEHDKIVELFAKRKIVPKAARKGAFVLSGLVYCGKCGHSMQFTFNGNNKVEYVKKCQKADPYGNRCGNRGINSQLIIDAIFAELQKYEKELTNKKYDVTENELEILKDAIKQKDKDITKEKAALGRLQVQREDGEISKETFIERNTIRQGNLEKLKKERSELEERCNQREQATDEKRLKTIKEFYQLWQTADSIKEKNMFLKTIIDKITYVREKDNISIMINFL